MKIVKQVSLKGIIVAAVLTALLAIGASGFVLWNAQAYIPVDSSYCKATTRPQSEQPVSADGLVVAEGAPAVCALALEKRESVREFRDIAGKTVSGISAVTTLILLVIVARRRG